MCFQHLPYNTRQILSVSENSVNLEDLADMADKMMEIYPDSHEDNSIQVSSKEHMSHTFKFQQQLTQLTRQLASLKATIATIHFRPARPTSRKRSVSRQRLRPHKRAAGISCYHLKYGERARRCIQPCNFTTNNQENQGNGPVRQ